MRFVDRTKFNSLKLSSYRTHPDLTLNYPVQEEAADIREELEGIEQRYQSHVN